MLDKNGSYIRKIKKTELSQNAGKPAVWWIAIASSQESPSIVRE